MCDWVAIAVYPDMPGDPYTWPNERESWVPGSTTETALKAFLRGRAFARQYQGWPRLGGIALYHRGWYEPEDGLSRWDRIAYWSVERLGVGQ